MALVICNCCSQVVRDNNVSKELAMLINEGDARYKCAECQKIDSFVKALEEYALDDGALDDVPDDVFINIMRKRGYNGTLRKTKVIQI